MHTPITIAASELQTITDLLPRLRASMAARGDVTPYAVLQAAARASEGRRTPKATIAAILASATMAGETAAEVEYDALTPETARALLRRAGSDVVPDYADEAAREIVRASCARTVRDADLRDTRIAILATEAWARAFRAAWPAEDVAALAAQD